METPAQKKRGLATPAPSTTSKRLAVPGTGGEVNRLQSELWAMRQRADEAAAAAAQEASAAALELLREKQRREELELQRDFLRRSEERLTTQLGEVRE